MRGRKDDDDNDKNDGNGGGGDDEFVDYDDSYYGYVVNKCLYGDIQSFVVIQPQLSILYAILYCTPSRELSIRTLDLYVRVSVVD